MTAEFSKLIYFAMEDILVLVSLFESHPGNLNSSQIWFLLIFWWVHKPNSNISKFSFSSAYNNSCLISYRIKHSENSVSVLKTKWMSVWSGNNQQTSHTFSIPYNIFLENVASNIKYFAYKVSILLFILLFLKFYYPVEIIYLCIIQ